MNVRERANFSFVDDTDEYSQVITEEAYPGFEEAFSITDMPDELDEESTAQEVENNATAEVLAELDIYTRTQRKKDSWQMQGVCNQIDPVLFAHEAGQNVTAKRICAGCPVLKKCLSYAVDAQEETGVWGGAYTAERERLNEYKGEERQQQIGTFILELQKKYGGLTDETELTIPQHGGTELEGMDILAFEYGSDQYYELAFKKLGIRPYSKSTIDQRGWIDVLRSVMRSEESQSAIARRYGVHHQALNKKMRQVIPRLSALSEQEQQYILGNPYPDTEIA